MYRYYTIALAFLISITTHISPIAHITTKKDFNTTLQSHSYVVVDFYADWCRPCKTITPVLESLSREYADMYFIKVNIENLSTIANQYNVRSIPTLIFFANGQEVYRLVGAHTKDTYRHQLNSLRGK